MTGGREPAMRNPFLIGTKVYLRALEEADASSCYEWFSDPEVRRTLSLGGRPNTEETSREYIRRRRDGPFGLQEFAIVVRADGAHIGNCGLFDFHLPARRCELGIAIGRKDCWGKGYGTEAVALLCRHAFETLNLHRVGLTCAADNERALRVYARVGFKPEGRLRDATFAGGRYGDDIVMGMLRGELVFPASTR